MIKRLLNNVVPLLKRTWEKFQADEGGNMAAALAFYALFSLFPLLLVTLSLLGYVAVPGSDVRADILSIAAASLPESAFEVVQDALTSLTENRGWVGLIGFATLLLGASGFFGALDRSLDKIWGVASETPTQPGLIATVLVAVREKALAFALVLGCVLLVLLSTIANLVIGALLETTNSITGPAGPSWAEVAVAQGVQLGVSFVALAVVLALLYRMLPSTHVAWGDVWPAAVVAALIFIILQRLVVGGIVNLGGSYQGYGVIGGVMLLLFYLSVSLQVLLLGAELSYAFAERYGSRREHTFMPGTDASPAPERAAIAEPRRTAVQHEQERTARAAGIGVLVGAATTAALAVMALVLGLLRAARLLRKN